MPRRKPTPDPAPRQLDAQKRMRVPDEVIQALGLDRYDFVGFKIEGDEVRIFRAAWSKQPKRD